MDAENRKATVVLDVGSDRIRAGIAGPEAAPQCTIGTYVRYPKTAQYGGAWEFDPATQRCVPPSSFADRGPSDSKDYYIGEEHSFKRGVLNERYPVDKGVVTDWGDMERIWRHLLDNELRVWMTSDKDDEDGDVHGVLHTEPIHNPKRHREIMTEIFFEQLGAPRFYLTGRPTMALYSAGRTTGTVLHSGDTTTNAVSLYEGYSMPHTHRANHKLSGSCLTAHLSRMVVQESKPGPDFVRPSSEKYAYLPQRVKQDYCYCARTRLDYHEAVWSLGSDLARQRKAWELCALARVERNNASPLHRLNPHLSARICKLLDGSSECKTFEMPDFSLVPICSAMVRIPELLFADTDIRADLQNNILLVGGNTMFPGLPERCQAEIEECLPDAGRAKVVAPPERQICEWLGGSILTSLSSFDESMWMHATSNQDANPAIIGYDDVGPRIVSQICIW